MKISKSQNLLILIFILIIILSIPIGNSGQRIIDFGFFKYIKNPLFNRVGNEYTILEIFQEIILLYSIFITLKIRKKFIRYSNILSFSLMHSSYSFSPSQVSR